MNRIATFALGQAAPFGLRRALEEAEALLLSAEAHAAMLADFNLPELPPVGRADAMQLRAVASLYLASTLEAAGLIQAADDLTRLLRSGALPGDPGSATPLIEAFWDDRNARASEVERLALFNRLFGAPAGPEDLASGTNGAFEELLLDLCDALMKAVEGGSQARVRGAALVLAENLSQAANGIVQMLAGEILGSLGEAIAILNHPDVRAMLGGRTMWDAVASIDRRLRRPPRPTLTHLRRGRAGMALLAWLADNVDRLEAPSGALVANGDLVIDAAIDWIDETLSIVRDGEGAGPAPAPDASGGSTWRDLGR
jgi:hypothetical protein